jgi:phenylalanine-4-hydroxylase
MRDNSQPNSTKVKGYGAGVLSSFGELEYSIKNSHFPLLQDRERLGARNTALPVSGGTPDIPNLLPWDPKVACVTDYPICSYQPNYFVAESMTDAKLKMRSFCESLPKPFYARYNSLTQSIWVDRALKVDELKHAEKINYTFE